MDAWMHGCMAAWLHDVMLNDVLDDVLDGMLDGIMTSARRYWLGVHVLVCVSYGHADGCLRGWIRRRKAGGKGKRTGSRAHCKNARVTTYPQALYCPSVLNQPTPGAVHERGGTSPSSSCGVECPDKAVFSIGTLVHSAAGIMKAGLIPS